MPSNNIILFNVDGNDDDVDVDIDDDVDVDIDDDVDDVDVDIDDDVEDICLYFINLKLLQEYNIIIIIIIVIFNDIFITMITFKHYYYNL